MGHLEVCILIDCCLWTSVVVTLLTSSPPLLPPLPLLRMTLVYVLLTSTHKSPRVHCHRSATQWFGRETRGPSVSPLEPPGPSSSIVLIPIPHHYYQWRQSHTLVFPASSTVPSTCGGGGRGEYCSHRILHLHRSLTPKPPRMPRVCVCVCAVRSLPPQKKKKRAWRIVEEEPVL